MSVYLSAAIAEEEHVQSSPNCLSRLAMTVARRASSDVAMLCISSFMIDVILAHNAQKYGKRHEKAYTQSDSPGDNTDLTPRHILKPSRQAGQGAKSDVYYCLIAVVVVV